jgi:hypothetical protein
MKVAGQNDVNDVKIVASQQLKIIGIGRHVVVGVASRVARWRGLCRDRNKAGTSGVTDGVGVMLSPRTKSNEPESVSE